MATLAAVRGSDYAWDPVEGTFTYPEEADRETWTPGSGGPHIRLESTESTQFYIDAIDALLFRPEVSQAMESGG